MKSLDQFLQAGDWKGEKHVPVIHMPEKIKSEELAEIQLSIGDAIKHPNTIEHHIVWMKLFYIAEGGKFPVELGSFDFRAHGEADAYDEPNVTTAIKFKSSGTLYALSYCNIHGLWQSSKEITVE